MERTDGVGEEWEERVEEEEGWGGKRWRRERVGEGKDGRIRVGEGKVARDCAVLKVPLKKPRSWTLANFEIDRRPCYV